MKADSSRPDFFSRNEAEFLGDLLKALGHPVRLQIIDILVQGEQSVNDLAEMVSQQQAIVSQQLKILRLSGMVQSRRQDGKALYSITVPNLKSMMSCLRGCKAAHGE